MEIDVTQGLQTTAECPLPGLETRVLPGDAAGVQAAAELLQAGQLVGIPTETVYGLAANAKDAAAVAQIFLAKGRPQDNPLIVHIARLSQLTEIAVNIPQQAYALAEAFWPGPLTVVLPRGEAIPASVSAGLDTVAVRMPSHPVAQAILRQSGLPLAAPSGNLSGKPSPTSAHYMLEDMQGRIPLIVDGGECGVGVESTVVSLCTPQPTVLRPGAVTAEQMARVLGYPVLLSHAITEGLKEGETAASPGMKYKHYAPKAQVTLVVGDARQYAAYVNSRAQQDGSGLMALCFAEDAPLLQLPYIEYGGTDQPEQQAQHVFTALRQLDEKGAQTVLAHCPQTTGVALAVYNRMLRAAAFRVIQLS